MNSTGPIDSWNVDPTTVGPLYPFAGWEIAMVIACAAFCVAFMVWKFKTENAKYAAKAEQLRTAGALEKALSANPLNDENRYLV